MMGKKRIVALIGGAMFCLAGWISGGVRTAAAESTVTPMIEGQDTSKWILDFQEEFDGPKLDPAKFSDIYLPHWSSEELVKANYRMDDGKIHLMIDQNQAGWRPGTRQQISSIQTGMKDGLHIWDSSLGISGHTPAQDLYGTKYGYFELRAKAQKGGGIHSAWWMIGDQYQYDKSAEVDIFEILGKNIYDNSSKVWVTIHPWYDTVIGKQRLNYWVDTDVSADYHTYGFEWLPSGMKWYFDGKLVRETKQSPDYKMYTLLGIYQSWGGFFSWQGSVDESQPYPKSFDIDYFRVYKTKEIKELNQKEDEAKQQKIKEQAGAAAIYGGDFTWDWYHQPSHLNDGRMDLTLQSQDDIKLPVHIYADFKEPTKLSSMSIFTHYGKGQGVTDLVVEYQDLNDGQWKEIAAMTEDPWKSDTADIEEVKIPFKAQITTKALRIRVQKANLRWRHFAINEIKLWE